MDRTAPVRAKESRRALPLPSPARHRAHPRSSLTDSFPLTAPDLACLLGDSPERPLDYALVLHFGRSADPPFDTGALRLGAGSARRAFPVAGSRLVFPGIGTPRWAPLDGASAAPVLRTTTDGDPAPLIQDFLAPAFRLEEEPPLRQLLVGAGDPPRWSLVTRVHHAASDLVGALLFVGHQLRIAQGNGNDRAPQHEPPLLKSPPKTRRRNPDWRPSTPLATEHAPRSPRRCWRSFPLAPRPRFASASPALDGFRWNDVLLVSALEALAWWNREQGRTDARMGLWVPVNIREERFVGFGNGTSRIRVRRASPTGGTPPSFVDRCRAMRAEVVGRKRAGEWALPPWSGLPLALPAVRPLLGRWLERPWADYGSAAFTHLERWPGDDDPTLAPVLEQVENIEVIACLHRRHPLYFIAFPHAGRPSVTLTWDPALLDSHQIESIAAVFTSALSDPATASPRPVATVFPAARESSESLVAG